MAFIFVWSLGSGSKLILGADNSSISGVFDVPNSRNHICIYSSFDNDLAVKCKIDEIPLTSLKNSISCLSKN